MDGSHCQGHWRRTREKQVEEMECKGNGFSSGLGRCQVPGRPQVEKPHKLRRGLLCELHLASCELEQSSFLSPKPRGLVGPNAFSTDWPSQALLVTLTSHSPLTAQQHKMDRWIVG